MVLLGMPSEPLLSPTRWSSRLKHPDARLENNGLDSIYNHPGSVDFSWRPARALVRANHPFPPHQASVRGESLQEHELFNPKTYFEIRVVSTEDQYAPPLFSRHES